jgi:thiamine biosynthesis lipoprotein
MPARGVRSVTVLSKTAMDADALCTAAFVMGAKKGLAFLEKRPGVEGFVVDADGQIHMTSGAKARITILQSSSLETRP